MSKIKVLVCNDDGIDAPGINALVNSIKDIADIVVVAPDRQQSAVGHALTISNPLRVKDYKKNGEHFGYSVNGTPADCIKIALSGLIDFKPDLVLSGINHGQNTAINILYSGTVSAASEAYLNGYNAIAFSLDSMDYNADFSAAEAYIKTIIEDIWANLPDEKFLLNVNIPYKNLNEIKGIKVVKHATTTWIDKFEKRNDPFNREYYWFAGEYRALSKDMNSDDKALEDNYITITPLKVDRNFTEQIEKFTFLTKK